LDEGKASTVRWWLLEIAGSTIYRVCELGRLDDNIQNVAMRAANIYIPAPKMLLAEQKSYKCTRFSRTFHMRSVYKSASWGKRDRFTYLRQTCRWANAERNEHNKIALSARKLHFYGPRPSSMCFWLSTTCIPNVVALDNLRFSTAYLSLWLTNYCWKEFGGMVQVRTSFPSIYLINGSGNNSLDGVWTYSDLIQFFSI